VAEGIAPRPSRARHQVRSGGSASPPAYRRASGCAESDSSRSAASGARRRLCHGERSLGLPPRAAGGSASGISRESLPGRGWRSAPPSTGLPPRSRGGGAQRVCAGKHADLVAGGAGMGRSLGRRFGPAARHAGQGEVEPLARALAARNHSTRDVLSRARPNYALQQTGAVTHQVVRPRQVLREVSSRA
jgi:hypothetical protein